jgi:hypothetical protein
MYRRASSKKSTRLLLANVIFAVVTLTILAWSADQRSRQAAGYKADLDRLVTMLRSNSFPDADTAASGLLDREPEAPYALALCGLARLKMGRIREAEAIFKTVIQESADNPEAHLGLGRLARIRNHPEEAVDHLRLAAGSAPFYEEALRQLWKTTLEGGEMSELVGIHELAERNSREDGKPLPSWLINGYEYIRGFSGKRLFEREGNFKRLSVPLIRLEGGATRMISLRLNEKGKYPFHIDSASPDFITISPLLAQELDLQPTGSSSAVGVGTQEARVRFSMLDPVAIGDIAFRNVPTMVSDFHTFRGRKTGLTGTGLLKRFNCTIDVSNETMDLFLLNRPDLLRAKINPANVVADVPLFLFDATTVFASFPGSPEGLFILDSAASTNLVDSDFFQRHLKDSLAPESIVPANIMGAQGMQRCRRINGLSIRLGPLLFDHQVAHEFPMNALNAITGRYAAGLVGNPLLWPYRVRLDF